MINYLRLLRVHQWIKNLFIFVPAFFDQKLLDVSCLSQVFTGFLAFSFVASSVYVLNDYLDLEEDRKHPKKQFRPLASGQISVFHAFSICSVILLAGIALSFYLSPLFLLFVGTYLVLNLFYTLRLKHVPILDVSIISFGFVLRVLAGGVLCFIEISEWLILITFVFALFIALAKRRDDVLLFLKSGEKTRKVVDGYNLDFLNIAMSIMASVVIVSYMMYSISDEVISKLGTEYIYLTVIFVVLGIFRYLQMAFVEENTGSPMEIIYYDRFMQLTVCAWLASVFVLLYFF